MTTFEPGASVVLTHGLLVRPFSTAFFATRAAPIMTVGFDVFVHEVIAALTTAPWSISTGRPWRVTVVGRLARRPSGLSCGECGSPAAPFPWPMEMGSLAGNVSA